MDTSILKPGYTIQGFSYARSKLYQGAAWIDNKNGVLGHAAGATVKILSKASEYVEVPIRTIEDIALFMINLVGVTFSKGCRKNMNYNVRCLGKDLWDIAVTALIISSKFLIQVVVIYHICTAILNGANNAKEKSDCNMKRFYRVQAIRKHGYSTVRRLDNILTSNCRSEFLLEVYKKINKYKTEDFIKYMDKLEEEQEKQNSSRSATSSNSSDWVCPEILKNDDSFTAKHIKRILRLSYNVSTRNMTKYQLKTYLCNLLDVGLNSTENEMDRAWRRLNLLLHPDRNNENTYSEAASAIINVVHTEYKSK